MRSNDKTNLFRAYHIPFAVFFILFFLSNCKKEIISALPGDVESIGLNFYPAYGTGIYCAIFVDKYIDNPVYGGSANFPTIAASPNGTIQEFPYKYGGVISYARYNAGSHRLMFTDTTKTIILDTTINFEAKSYTNLYLTDMLTAINAPATYKLVAVEETPIDVPADRVAIRFIDLSADAGTLVCSRLKSNGSLTNALPTDLHFGEASDYQYFTALDVVNGLIRFSLDNPSNGASIITGVSYNPGKSYAVAISGFWNDQQRQINIGKNPDGSIKYKSITIGRNLHTDLRRTN